MSYNILLVALGGAAGSVLRYLISKWLNLTFPTGTLAVNLAGCFIIGLLWGIFSKHPDDQKRLLLMTGFCGGFTTFSSFTFESVQLLFQERIMTLWIYMFVSIAGGLLLTYFGYKLTT